MSLLREIQQASVDSDIELTTLLRKCKILAARLNNAEFKDWVENELNGYEDYENLPSYRVISVYSKGNFLGAFGRSLTNANIPISSLPKEIRKDLSNSYLPYSVAYMESLVRNDEGSGILKEAWNPDLVAYYGQQIYQSMNCMEAWKIIPQSSVASILDNIRNRILSFVLEIESEEPEAGDAPINSNPIPQEKISQIFNNYINGDVHNIANASSDFSQTVKVNSDLNAELFNGLIEAIRQTTLDKQIIIQLNSSIEQMRINQNKDGFKAHYVKFMSLLADHMQILGPAIGMYLPQLASLMK